MKKISKTGGRYSVPTDQPFVDYENLVTGAKFNYDRPQATEQEIKSLCVEESWSRKDKFLYLLDEGDKIQKWSIFENFKFYATTKDIFETLLEKVIKVFPQLTDYIPILGNGITELLENNHRQLSKKQVQLILRLIFLVINKFPHQINDWSSLLKNIMSNNLILPETFSEYINGSFDMNSPPQRRRVAFEIIENLLKRQFSKICPNIAHNKVIFFSKDQNEKTRQTICRIIAQLLAKNRKDEELWKIIWQYFQDTNKEVKEKAFEILTTIYNEKNFKLLLNLFSENQDQIFLAFIQEFVLTFSKDVEKVHGGKIEIIAFIHRIFKQRNVNNICSLLKKINREFIGVIGDCFQEQVNFSLLDLKDHLILEQLFKFYHEIESQEFQETIKTLILRGLKAIKYQISSNAYFFAQMLDLDRDQQISLFTTVCTNLFEESKWHQLGEILDFVMNIHPFKTTYEKLTSLFLRLLMEVPEYLISKLMNCIVHLFLLNRRSLQFLIMIREKILNSKFWWYRKNYILLYRILKQKTSFEYQKMIPSLLYKSIMSEKSYGVKLIFLECASDIYMFTEPSNIEQKDSIKEVVVKLQQDKDYYVKEKAKVVLLALAAIDKDSNWLSTLYSRNQKILKDQQNMRQVLTDTKKTIKTESQIRKNSIKRRVGVQTRKTLNYGRKDVNSNTFEAINPISNTKGLTSQGKRTNIFRCHSVKIKNPIKKL